MVVTRIHCDATPRPGVAFASAAQSNRSLLCMHGGVPFEADEIELSKEEELADDVDQFRHTGFVWDAVLSFTAEIVHLMKPTLPAPQNFFLLEDCLIQPPLFLRRWPVFFSFFPLLQPEQSGARHTDCFGELV